MNLKRLPVLARHAIFPFRRLRYLKNTQEAYTKEPNEIVTDVPDKEQTSG